MLGRAICLLFSLALLEGATDPTIVTATDSGWVANNGQTAHFAEHPEFGNYAVGWDPVDFDTGINLRNFFVFDLSDVTDTITTATLDLYMPTPEGYLSHESTEPYVLTGTTTAATDLIRIVRSAGNPTGQVIYASFGTGTVFASITVSPADQGTTLHLALNAAGVSYLNDNRGKMIVLSGQDPDSPTSGSTIVDCRGPCRFFFTETDPTGAGIFAQTPRPTLTLGFAPLPPASVSIVSGDQQSGVAGSPLSNPVVVEVQDANHGMVSEATVMFTAENATVDPASVTTDAQGRASTRVTLGDMPGTATVTAMVAGLPAVTFHATVNANPSLPTITGVVNGASYIPEIAAASWVTITGQNLSATTRSWGADDFIDGALPTLLDGVSVTINGKPAFVYYISPTQLNVLAPDDPAAGPVAIQVTNAAGVSAAYMVDKAALSPGLFLFTEKYPAAVHADGVYLGPPGLIAGATTTPAQPGEIVLLFGSGFGATDPAIPADHVFSTTPPIAAEITATVGGVPAEVHGYLISPGLYQFNLTVPEVPDGDAAIVIHIAGRQTPDGLFLAVQH